MINLILDCSAGFESDEDLIILNDSSENLENSSISPIKKHILKSDITKKSNGKTNNTPDKIIVNINKLDINSKNNIVLPNDKGIKSNHDNKTDNITLNNNINNTKVEHSILEKEKISSTKDDAVKSTYKLAHSTPIKDNKLKPILKHTSNKIDKNIFVTSSISKNNPKKRISFTNEKSKVEQVECLTKSNINETTMHFKTRPVYHSDMNLIRPQMNYAAVNETSRRLNIYDNSYFNYGI